VRSLVPSLVAAILGYFAARLIIPGPATAHLSPPLAITSAVTSGQGAPALPTSAAEPTASTPPPTLKEVKSAMSLSSGVFIAAARWQAWLDAATAEDLKRFVADPKSLPDPGFNDYQQQFRRAFYAALVERWFAVDENALASIRKLADAVKTSDFRDASELMDAATKVRPELFLNDLNDKKPSLSREESSALRHLAARDARKARELAASLTNKARQSAEIVILQGIAENDPLSALALCRSLDPKDAQRVHGSIIAAAERIGPGMLRQVFADSGETLGGNYNVQNLLLRYPDLATFLKAKEAKPLTYSPIADHQQFRAVDLMSPEDRARRVEQCAAMPEGIRDSMAAALAASWARDEPLKAADWAMKLAKPETAESPANQAAHFAFLRWIQVDRPSALAWLRSQPESPLRASIGTNAASFLAEAADFESAMALCRPNGSQADQQPTAHFVQIYAERDPAAAAAWLANTPNAIDGQTASKVVEAWYPSDPLAVGRWVEGLPAGKGRDEALNALVHKLSWESPAAAAEWTETIADATLREKAAGFAYYSLSRDDPARAREWLQNLGGVQPKWKERMLRNAR
jgi:hypothetical protein